MKFQGVIQSYRLGKESRAWPLIKERRLRMGVACKEERDTGYWVSVICRASGAK
jgi:hypothetical protein